MTKNNVIPFGRTHNPKIDSIEKAMGFGQFTCPKCGSHFFSGQSSTGYCKGRWINDIIQYSGCDFRWKRPDEDDSVGLTKPDHTVRFVIDENHVGHIVHDEVEE